MTPSEPSGSGGAKATEAGKRAAQAQREAALTEPTTVFVELGAAEQRAQIARDGVQVVSPDIDETVLNQVLAGKPNVVPRVLLQSVKPGTSVPKGTTVDIVLAEPRALPTKIVKDVHRGLEDWTLGMVYDTFLRDDSVMRGVIARNERAEPLSQADQSTISKAFHKKEVTISDDPGQTMREAFLTLQAAYTFVT